MNKIIINCLTCCAFLFSSALIFANDSAVDAGKLRAAVCIGCHGLQGEGKDALNGQPAFPRLAGQKKSYLVKSVNDYKEDKRDDPMMSAIAKGLSDIDINNLAAFYSSLK